MIRLRLFGTIELVDPDGREIGPVLQQSKRLALLALLAGVGSEWHRRDTLVATFWPERDTEHARASLRRALTFLRTHLGDGVLRTRGDEVGVATEALWCDLAACLAALREGRHAEAVELRRGELLPGLHVPSAPDFERWLDGMRERVRQDTAAAAARLAADAERAGALADAAAWRRRALELHPHDETGLRALLVLLDRLGDRAGALRAYDEFTTRLAQELDLPPDPETTALAGRIRARAQTVSAPVTAGHARSRNVVAVFPFTVRGPADVQYLREGIVDLLAAKLDGAGELRTADSGSVLARAEALGAGAPDPAAARAIAAELGAGAFVLGSLVADGERVLVRATLHETDGTRDVRAGAEGSTNASIFSLVDDFVRDLLASRTESLGGQLTRLGARMTRRSPRCVPIWMGSARCGGGGHGRAGRRTVGRRSWTPGSCSRTTVWPPPTRRVPRRSRPSRRSSAP